MRKKRALVVVDYQNDFVTEPLGVERAVRLEQSLVQKIRSAKQTHCAVFLPWINTKPQTWTATEPKRRGRIACLIQRDGACMEKWRIAAMKQPRFSQNAPSGAYRWQTS